jgi:RIO kinase 1
MRVPWLIAEPEAYDEYDLGPLKTGKEAEVFLIERVATDGRSCLLAHKRYRPRDVRHKGELQELGLQRARTS